MNRAALSQPSWGNPSAKRLLAAVIWNRRGLTRDTDTPDTVGKHVCLTDLDAGKQLATGRQADILG